MERLKSHRDFVAVLKKRRKVSSRDIVAHYLMRDDTTVCSALNQVNDFTNNETTGFDSSPAEFFDTLKQPEKSYNSNDSAKNYSFGVKHAEKEKCKRLGLAVSKSVGKAVVRNLVKRRFRVLASKYESLLPCYCDVVLRAKPSAANATFASLNQQVEKLFINITNNAKIHEQKSNTSFNREIVDQSNEHKSDESSESLYEDFKKDSYEDFANDSKKCSYDFSQDSREVDSREVDSRNSNSSETESI